AGRRARSRRSPATPRAPGPEAAMERVALVNTPSLRKRAVSRGMAGGLGFDGAETLVLPPLDLALMAATLRGAGFAVELIDADPLGLDDAQVYERLDGTSYAAIVASVSLPTLEADAAFLAGLGARHPEPRLPLPVRLLLPLPPRRGQGVARAVAGARPRGAPGRRRAPRHPEDLFPRRHLHARSEAGGAPLRAHPRGRLASRVDVRDARR